MADMVLLTIMSKIGTRHMPLTPERRQAFLHGLRESGGSFSHACRVSSPHLDGQSANPPAYQSWKNLLASDPTFAAEYEETMEAVKGDIIAELHRRSVEGTEEPVYQKGERVLDFDGTPATIRKYSDSLLSLRARAVLKGDYIDRKTVDVNVRTSTAGLWTISGEDLAALTEAQKDQLKGIMLHIRDHRRDVAAIPAPAAQERSEPTAEVIEDETEAEVAEWEEAANG